MARERFLDTAASLADGAPIDWEATDAAVSSDHDRRVLRQLRVVAEVAEVHRSGDEEAIPPPDPGDVWTTMVVGRVEVGGRTVPAVQPPATERRDTPRTWGHLRLLEKVGEGTFGEVYRAYDTRLSRYVALKLLHVGARSRSALAARLLHEGQALARVQQQHVVTVFGAEEYDDRVGLWMELVEGRTLAESVARDGPYSAREAAIIGQDLCRALSAVHGAGLLHRDIKAQNVMREQGGRVVLMDFGAGEPRDRAARTGHVRMTGTPLYLAPEIVAGGPASAQSDIYSVGVLLFFLVTGRFPVEAETLDELRAKHAHDAQTHLHDLRPDLPDAFVSLVERAIDVDPARRPASAGVLQAALSRSLGVDQHAAAPAARDARGSQPEPRPAPRPGARLRFGHPARWLGRTRPPHRLGVVAAAVLLAVAAGAVWWMSRPAPADPSGGPILVLRPFERGAGVPEYLAQTFTEHVHRELGLLRGGFDVAALDALGGAGARGDGAVALTDLGAQYLVEGRLRRDARQTTLSLELLRAGVDLPIWSGAVTRPNSELSRLQADVVRVVADELAATSVPASAEQAPGQEAYEAYLRGRYALSGRQYDEAIGHLNRARSLQPDFAPAWAELAKVYLGRFESHGVRAMRSEVLDAARFASEHALSLDPDVPEAHGVLADLEFAHDWSWDAAERRFRQALAANPSDVTTRLRFAMFLAARGRTAEAIDEIERGRRLNPLSAETVGYAGMAYHYARDHARAVQEFRAALTLDPELAGPHVGLCRALRAQGDLAGARAACGRAMARQAEAADAASLHAEVAWNAMQAEVAQIEAMDGNDVRAREIFEALEEAHAEDPDRVSPYRLALVQAGLGDADEAFRWLGAALDRRALEVLFLVVDPRLDAIRTDPRFGAQVKRLGLAPARP